ncbi:hypothetical protein EV363DRAFT_1309367, partial [Boletus edulis]
MTALSSCLPSFFLASIVCIDWPSIVAFVVVFLRVDAYVFAAYMFLSLFFMLSYLAFQALGRTSCSRVFLYQYRTCTRLVFRLVYWNIAVGM